MTTPTWVVDPVDGYLESFKLVLLGVINFFSVVHFAVVLQILSIDFL